MARFYHNIGKTDPTTWTNLQIPPVRRRRRPLRLGQVNLRQPRIASHHLQRRMPQQILKRSHIPPIAQKVHRKGVPEPVRRRARHPAGDHSQPHGP